MTRRNPERPPGPSYYRLPEASWTMIRDEYLSGWTAKEIGAKWRVSPTSVYRHASDGGWNKDARGQAFHDQIVAADDAERGETWTSLKDPVPPSMRRWPHPLPGMGPMRRPAWSPPPGQGPMPPDLVPGVPRPADGDGTLGPGEVAEQAVAAAGRAVMEGRYQEAERLGKLAETMRRLAGGGVGPKVKAARFTDDADADEDVSARLPNNERLLNCTMDTCAVFSFRERALEGIMALSDQAHIPLADDLIAWTDMAGAMQAQIDPEVAETAAAFQATGMENLHERLGALLGPMPERPRAPRRETFR